MEQDEENDAMGTEGLRGSEYNYYLLEHEPYMPSYNKDTIENLMGHSMSKFIAPV